MAKEMPQRAPKKYVEARERAFKILDEAGEEIIFGEVSDGMTQKALAEEYDVSRFLLREWISNSEGRRQRYEDAWSLSADAYAEEALEIADQTGRDVTGMVARDKLRVNVRKWAAEKRNPTKYQKGSRIEIEGGGDLGAGLLAALMDYGHPDAPGMQRIRAKQAGQLEDESTAATEEAVEADYEMLEEGE